MSLAAPPSKDLFDPTFCGSKAASPAGLGELFAELADSIKSSRVESESGLATFKGPYAHLSGHKASTDDKFDEITKDLSKSLTPDQLASLQTALGDAKAAMADITKDISLTNPFSTGGVPFDLEAPSKKIFPVYTPWRNLVPRVHGQGTSRRYKRVTGISGSGTGGATLVNPGITDSTTSSWGAGNLSLQRPPKINYAGDEHNLSYVQMGLSDSVEWSAEFAGQGFEDMRDLSNMFLLYASMLADENVIAFGRGTLTGYLGALGTPSAPTVTARNAGTGETGNSANIANLFVYLTAITPLGETVASSGLNSTALSAVTGKVLDVAITAVTGATGYNVYAGTTSGSTNSFLYGTANWSGSGTGQGVAPFTIQFTGAGTGGALNAGTAPPVSGTSANAANFDGIVSLCQSTGSGYQKVLNTVLSTSNPAIEYQNAFGAMYQTNKADPDDVWMNGFDRKQLSESIHGGSSTPPAYRIQLDQAGAADVTVGTVVTSLLNEITGKEVRLAVYPWMPQGSSVILSWTLPFPNTEIPSCWAYPLVQDYMAIQWPTIQLTYDVSSYWFGTVVPYGLEFQGSVSGIVKA